MAKGTKGTPLTLGARHLRSWLAAQRAESSTRTAAWLGAILGVARPTVAMWLTGRGRPEHLIRVEIERLTGNLADEWMTRAERDDAANRTARVRQERKRIADAVAMEGRA